MTNIIVYVFRPVYADVKFNFDRSCNLSCPSCRSVAYMANGEEIDFIDEKINDIVDIYGKNLEFIYLSGTADPFASKSFKKFLSVVINKPVFLGLIYYLKLVLDDFSSSSLRFINSTMSLRK